MEAFLDMLWEYLAAGMVIAGQSFFSVLQNLHFAGPAVIIALLAGCTVAITKLLNRLIITKRYIQLEKEYHHWYQLRQEAIKCEDREKGKRIARNIDQAELNRAYYDYFFEGLLLGMARKVIPIFFVFAFINEFYRPEAMLDIFGRQYVIQLTSTGGDPVLIGTVFWYFICLIGSYILWSICTRLLKISPQGRPTSLQQPTEEINC